MTNAPKDVTKREAYLGKEWCPVSLKTMKEVDILLNNNFVLSPLFKK